MSWAFHPVKTKFRRGRRAPRPFPAALEKPLSAGTHPQKLISRPVARLEGRARAPGDKSVSHRALMFGALALGETAITGLLEGEDVLCTAAALRALGAGIVQEGTSWRVRGFGVGGGREPDHVLDLGNSGTSARLLSGILASHRFTSFMTGDGSLRRRMVSTSSQLGQGEPAAVNGGSGLSTTGRAVGSGPCMTDSGSRPGWAGSHGSP